MPNSLRLAFAVLLLAATAVAVEHPVGSHGAVLELGPGWERRVVVPDVGRDQFLQSSRNILSVVVEMEELLESRADVEAALERFIAGVEARLKDVDTATPVVVREDGLVRRATRRFTGRYGGVRLAYQFDLVARHGLGYLIMSWAPVSSTVDLHDWASRAARGLRFPAADSEWGRRAALAPHTFRFGGWNVVLTYRQTVLDEQGSADTPPYELVTAGGEGTLYLLDETFDDSDPERALSDVVDMLLEDDDSGDEVWRDDVVTEHGSGREALLRFGAASDEYCVRVALIPLEKSRFLDLRLVSVEPPQRREELWRELLRSLEVTAPPAVDAFPEVAPPAPPVPALSPAAQLLLAASQPIGTSSGWRPVFAVAAAGRVLAEDGAHVVALGDGGAQPLVTVDSSSYAASRLAMCGDRVLLLGTGHGPNQLAEAAGGALTELDVEADAVAILDDHSVLLARTQPAEAVPGLTGLPQTQLLLVRDCDGSEREVAQLGRWRVQALAGSADGDRALLAASDHDLFRSDLTDTSVHLLELDTATGRERHLERWPEVQALAPAGDGWLVTGRPLQGGRGVYLVGHGASELLLSGEAVGIELAGDQLVFAVTGMAAPTDPDSGRWDVYRTPLAQVREHGPHLQPLSAPTLSLIATRTLGSLALVADEILLGDLPTVLEVVRTADRLTEDIVGVPLPATSEELDDLMAQLYFAAELDDAGETLLAALLVRALVEDGAEWVTATADGGDDDRVGAHAFALAFLPREVVRSTVYNEYGWKRPASELRQEAAGRRLLLGGSPQTLRARLEELAEPDTGELVRSGTPRELRRLLAAHPDNVYLRRQVYRELAAAQRLPQLAKLARRVYQDSGAADDLQAWCAAQLHQGAGDDEVEELVGELRTVIAEAPTDPQLYLLLGTAYERLQRPQHARACYVKVSELRQWGDVAQQAEAGMARLDGKAGGG